MNGDNHKVLLWCQFIRCLFSFVFRCFSISFLFQIMRDPEMGNSRGFGFISHDSFDASDAAIEAMNGQYLCNRQMTVSYAYKKDTKGERHGTPAESFGCQQSNCPKKQASHVVCERASYTSQCSSGQWHHQYSNSSTPFCKWLSSSTTNGTAPATHTRCSLPTHANVWSSVLAGAASATWSSNATSFHATTALSAVQTATTKHATTTFATSSSSIYKAASTTNWNVYPSTCLAATATASAAGREAPFYATDVNATTSPIPCSTSASIKLKVDQKCTLWTFYCSFS
ncbi:hypothetical protein ACSBR2_024841 [Camellia fascicularis]